MTFILEAFLNTLWQNAAIALLAWAALRWTPRVNAATREAVWWAVLAFVVLLPLMRGVPAQRPIPREPSSVPAPAPVPSHRAPDPLAGESFRANPAPQLPRPNGSG